MARRSPQEQADRVAELLGKAARLQSASIAGKVMSIIKKKPGLARSILDFAERLDNGGGGLDMQGAMQPLLVAALPETASSVEASPAKSDATSGPSEGPEPSPMPTPPSKRYKGKALETLLARPIDRQSYRIELLPVCDIKNKLYNINGTTFTEWTLKSLLRQGQRDVARTSLCEILEFLTAVPGNSCLSNTYWPTVADLAKHLRTRAIQQGDRATSLTMPPD